jgi:hypothetical protein
VGCGDGCGTVIPVPDGGCFCHQGAFCDDLQACESTEDCSRKATFARTRAARSPGTAACATRHAVLRSARQGPRAPATVRGRSAVTWRTELAAAAAAGGPKGVR